MREIKFRVWDKKEKKFKIKDEKLNFGDIKEFLTAVIDFDESSIQVNGNERYEFLQYTGLKDKNNKEIYEGDIVEGEWIEYDNKHKGLLVVEFDEEENSLKPFTEIVGEIYLAYGERNECKPNMFKVIGNKFENPELLESD